MSSALGLVNGAEARFTHLVGLFHWIHEQREKLILGNAYHLLDEDEDVVQWVRIVDTPSKREGFAFVTPLQMIIHWNGRRADNTNFRWEQVECWAVNGRAERGPVLVVEGEGFEATITLASDTNATAERVSDFLRRFARHAPKSTRQPANALPSGDADWRSDGDVDVQKVPRTPLEMARRIFVTLVGVTIFIIGIIIIPLPGPWSFPVNLLGLAILASEYDWAKDGRMWTSKQYAKAKAEIRRRRAAKSHPGP